MMGGKFDGSRSDTVRFDVYGSTHAELVTLAEQVLAGFLAEGRSGSFTIECEIAKDRPPTNSNILWHGAVTAQVNGPEGEKVIC